MGCLTCCASPHIEANRAEGGGLLDAISYAQSECSMGGLSKFACNWAPMCFFDLFWGHCYQTNTLQYLPYTLQLILLYLYLKRTFHLSMVFRWVEV